MRVVRGLNAAKTVVASDRESAITRVPDAVLKKLTDALGNDMSAEKAVELILNKVRNEGDKALKELTFKLDGIQEDSFEVPKSALVDAYSKVDGELVRALEVAVERCTRFHQSSLPQGWTDSSEGYGEILLPLDTVGAYIPRGLVSTVLMTGIPSKVAGVEQVVICTPPSVNGLPEPALLVAADLVEIDRVFAIGGAQAIAAMAYGTESIPKVDIVCGPGNVFVTLAKKALFGQVGIDGLYGPTETAIIADNTANPSLCASDLLAQSEHDVMAMPVLITMSENVAAEVQQQIVALVDGLERRDIARASLNNRGLIVIVEDLKEALALANELAPEHLSLMVDQPSKYVGDVRNAGALFLGEFSHEVLGDYVAGPSHVMPTAGTARFNSGINVRSFLKIVPVVDMDRETAMSISKEAAVIANAEGLTGHALAAEIRNELDHM